MGLAVGLRSEGAPTLAETSGGSCAGPTGSKTPSAAVLQRVALRPINPPMPRTSQRG